MNDKSEATRLADAPSEVIAAAQLITEWALKNDIAEFAIAGIQQRRWPLACPGRPDSRCNYDAHCGQVCNKCGRVHDGTTPSEFERIAPLSQTERMVSLERLKRIAALEAENATLRLERDQANADRKQMQEAHAALEAALSFVERWANHHATKPHMTAEQALSVIQHYPVIKAITKGYEDGKVPDTPDPWAALEEARGALADLVDLKEMKSRLQRLTEMGHGTDYTDYFRLKPLAWHAARNALRAIEEVRRGQG